MANRYCGNCGHELPEDVRFCPNCGRAVHQTARVPTPEADVDVPPPPQGTRTGAWQTATPSVPQTGEPQQGWGRRHPILTGCLAIVGLFFLLPIIIGVVGGGGGDETAGGGGGAGVADQQAQQQADEEPQVQEQANEGQQSREQESQAASNPRPTPEYTVGQTATVGNVEWTVSDAYRTTLLKSNFGTRKRGNFVVVDFTFTNNRPEEVTLDPELHLTLRDSGGREFGTDPDAWEFVPIRKNIFLEPVNPGISQDGLAVYEVPPDAEGYVLIVDDVEFMEDKTARYDLGTLPTRASG